MAASVRQAERAITRSGRRARSSAGGASSRTRRRRWRMRALSSRSSGKSRRRDAGAPRVADALVTCNSGLVEPPACSPMTSPVPTPSTRARTRTAGRPRTSSPPTTPPTPNETPRLVLVLLGALTGGCSLVADEPPEAAPQATVPELVEVSGGVPQAERVRLRLARDSAARRAQRLTVRVRNLTCEGVVTGSGFALAGDPLLVTNRHVLAGAEGSRCRPGNGRAVQVGSARGRPRRRRARVRRGAAAARRRVRPAPETGDLVAVVGYPRGGLLTLSEGRSSTESTVKTSACPGPSSA